MCNLVELKQSYLKLKDENGISENDIRNIEEKLNVHLPYDFKNIATYFRGGILGTLDTYDFIDSIIDETLKMRKDLTISHQYIVLAQDDESVLLLDTVQYPGIIWCDLDDIMNLCSNKFMKQPDIWGSYSDFFHEMMDTDINRKKANRKIYHLGLFVD